MRTESYRSNPSRVTVGLVTGAATGALLVSLYYLWHTAQILGVQYTLHRGWHFSVVVFILAFAVWHVGLIVFALPLWWLLHKLRLRHWLLAAVVGAAMTFVVDVGVETGFFGLIPPVPDSTDSADVSASDAGGLTIAGNRLTPHGWWVKCQDALLLSAAGVIVTLVIWRIIYRRVDNAPD